MNEIQRVVSRIARPDRLWSRSECLARPSPVPKVPGLYGWYFRELPPCVAASGCVHSQGCALLYVGIAPTRPFGIDGRPSTSSLRSRIRTHYSRNAEGSTLRLTLGSLLAASLGLRRASSTSKSFGNGEHKLSEWMAANAYVSWIEHSEPWLIEPAVIASLDLPLNLAHNPAHPFRAQLLHARSKLKRPLSITPGV